MYEYKELFDVSVFLKSSKYYCDKNKKIVGKMKDEYGGKINFEIFSSKIKDVLNTR